MPSPRVLARAIGAEICVNLRDFLMKLTRSPTVTCWKLYCVSTAFLRFLVLGMHMDWVVHKVRCIILEMLCGPVLHRESSFSFLNVFLRFLFLCGIVFMFFFVVFHCMVLLCALALCVYLCVGLLYIDIVYCATVLHCIFVCGCQLA